MLKHLISLYFILLLVFSDGREVYYHNQFALRIPSGDPYRIGQRHDLNYIGPILNDYHLFEVHHIHKRSLEPHEDHQFHEDEDITWYEQQIEKNRIKRDNDVERTDTIFQPSDPLFERQWFLNQGAHDGSDMNVVEAWKLGITGKGVVVTILDDGIQTNHPDLIDNYDPLASTDINDNDDNPMPQDDGDNKHGTRCAGEVAAIAFNDYCGVGVAYNASIGGVRMLDGVVNDAVEARALSLRPNHIHIYSASWGPEDDGKTVDGPGRLTKEAFISGILKGRSGRGSIFVWASGNGGRRDDNCNCDGYTNSIYTLSISSATQGGYKPWYLEECSSTLASTYSSGTPSHDASITTVDQDGKLRPDRLCTSSHTGTSASAPIAAGVCALVLEANTNLTWRDLQYLVVASSNPLPLIGESGWYVNGVGKHYSHKFGYGLMDAGTMVKSALNWKLVGPQMVYKSEKIYPNKTLRKESLGEVVYAFIYIKESNKLMNHLEHVQAVISITGSPRGSLELVLISPSGTRSILLMKRSKDTRDGSFEDWPFLSVHFWGETPTGKWTLEVIRHEDIQPENSNRKDGVLKDWQLIFYGVEDNPLRDNVRANNSNLGEQVESYDEYEGLSNDTVGVEVSTSDCDNSEKCLKCKSFIFNNNCVENCPNKTFPAQGYCKPCHFKCNTCYGPQLNQCLTCTVPYLFLPESSSCHKVCPSSHFLEKDYNICLPCFNFKNCLQCHQTTGNCILCNTGFFVTPESYCSPYCPSGFYSDSKENQCSTCHTVCEECFGPKQSQCISCKDGKFYHERTCLEKCPSSHYENKDLKECTPCSKGCLECPLHPRKCQKCEENWILLGNKCFPAIPNKKTSCPMGSYYDLKKLECSSCHDQCQNCFGRGPDHCITCNKDNPFHHISSCLHTCPSYFTYPEGLQCNHCPHSCRSCTGAKQCNLCNSGSVLTSDGRCVAKCPQGYFPSIESLKCEPCHRNCKSCIGIKENECISCLDSFVHAPDGSCRSTCPDGFFLQEGECRPCHGRCKTCFGQENDNCLSCFKGLLFEGSTCWACKSGEYYDDIAAKCLKCHLSCRQCFGDLANECLSCNNHRAFNKWNNTCEKCCMTDENDCCECNKSKTICVNPNLNNSRKRSSYTIGRSYQLNNNQMKRNESGIFYIFTASTILFVVLVYFIRRNRYKCRSRFYNHYQGYTKVAYDNISDHVYLSNESNEYESDDDNLVFMN
nr:furin-like [Lepeophtheirus salmonis]